jgi:hypothetical protein
MEPVDASDNNVSVRKSSALDMGLALAEHSTDHWVVCTKAYFPSPVPEFERFREIAVRRLGLHAGSSDKFLQPVPRYTIFLPSKEQCISFWRRAFFWITNVSGQEVTEPLVIDAATQALLKLEQEGRVRAFAVPPEYATLPLILFEPDDHRNACAFISLLKERSDNVDKQEQLQELVEIPKPYIKQMLHDVYIPVVFDGRGDPVKFEDHQNVIVDQTRLSKNGAI